MEKVQKFKTNSEKETLAFGQRLINLLDKEVKLILLEGELAAGKTVVTKGIATKLSIKDEITSPTFGYKRVYDNLVHYDLYLLKKVNKKELLSTIQEDIENGNYVVIEWGNKLPKIKNSAIVKIRKGNKEDERLITIKVN